MELAVDETRLDLETTMREVVRCAAGRSVRSLVGIPGGWSVGRALVDGFDQEKARAGDGLLCGAITQRGTPTNRRNAEIQKQQTSWRYKKWKTRNEERRSTGWKPD